MVLIYCSMAARCLLTTLPLFRPVALVLTAASSTMRNRLRQSGRRIFPSFSFPLDPLNVPSISSAPLLVAFICCVFRLYFFRHESLRYVAVGPSPSPIRRKGRLTLSIERRSHHKRIHRDQMWAVSFSTFETSSRGYGISYHLDQFFAQSSNWNAFSFKTVGRKGRRYDGVIRLDNFRTLS